jgi:hypothetical protein
LLKGFRCHSNDIYPTAIAKFAKQIEAMPSFFSVSDCVVPFDGVYPELPKDLGFLAMTEETVCLCADTLQLAAGLFILEINTPLKIL